MPSPKFIVSTSSSGLSNRLHTHASSLRLAKKLGRQALIHWPSTSQLNVAFDQLFKNQWPIATKQHLDDTLFNTSMDLRVYNVMRSGRVRPSDPESVLLFKSWRELRMIGESRQEAMNDELHILRELQPVDQVTRSVEAVLDRLVKPFIGVHIRTCDVVGLHFSKGSPIQRVHEIYAKGPADFIAELAPFSRNGYGIFVCSDDAECEQAIETSFPNVVRCPKGVGWRETVDGMLEALVDLYALSTAKAILGTAGSQFSELASELGGTPLFLAGRGQLNLEAVGRLGVGL
jgi:hypothetical protein